MAKNVVQKVKFKATPEELYQTYMDPKKHAKAIGSKVSLQPKVGGSFSAFGMLQGRFLLLEKGKKIVQTWRGNHWKKNDPDSILIPDHDYQGVQKGWPQYYWRSWKKYLAK